MTCQYAMLSVFILTMIAAQGQQIEITGTVKDAETREPIAFATVYCPQAKIGTTTNVNGNFSLSVPNQSGMLAVSSVGYVTDSISLSKHLTKYSIALRADVHSLKE